jgi:hypothetical protein
LVLYNFYISGNLVDSWHVLAYYFCMKLGYDTAAELLSQLGNQTRLKIVRELVRAGKTGMAVGEIQKKLGIPNSRWTPLVGQPDGWDKLKAKRKILKCKAVLRQAASANG